MCFVVMGFGKKTDYSGTPRTLDLDATYDAIIKPAVTRAGLDCVRADEVSHSGLIDVKMFELLLRADVVVADISTANPNALYELGVRHALRPFTTILMKEVDGKFHFDLNHLATIQYKHLGEDIGAKEAAAKSSELEKVIRAVVASQAPDSPVYTFLAGLKQPMMSSAELRDAAKDVARKSESFASEVEEGKKAALRSAHAEARDHFARARKQQEGAPDPFVVQQLALHTYKAKQPDAVSALVTARQIVDALGPKTSTDPETLGIAGAIEKRLWEERSDRDHLEAAIELYGRGFHVRGDYYNGENYAACLDTRAALQTDPAEERYDTMTARKVRERIIANLRPLLRADAPGERPRDYLWMLATMAGTHYALGVAGGEEYEQRFRAMNPPGWAIETFERGKRKAAAGGPKTAGG
jgi:hypothetical protein